MSLGNSNNVIIVVLLGLAGIMFVIASLTGGKKWRRLYDEERDEYATYAEGADTELRDARQRIADLERDYGALQQQHSDALASIAALKSAPPPAVVEPAPVPLKLVPSEEHGEPAEPFAAEPEHVPVDAEPEAAAPEHRPIAQETVAEETDARPIAAFGVPLTELPPAPIHGVTPLRAAEPPEPDAAPPAEVTPPVSEAAHAEPEHHAEAAHTDAPEHPAKTSYLGGTLAHLAEGVAIAEVAHLAWNAYAAHKHHDEAEHHAEPVKASEPEAVHHASPEPGAEAPHSEAAEAAVAEVPAKAWFGSARRDDLTRMRGVDATINTRLSGLGVTSYDDIVHLSQEDEMALEQRLDLPAGYITREQWRDQADLLRFGKDAEFDERFGTADA
jgi:predicted flap endonuclease-1-like 5' DNA nuclease